MKKVVKIILIVLLCLFSIIVIYLFTKFKNVSIELGDEIKINDFVRYGTIKNVSVDLNGVNNNVVGSYSVDLKYFFINRKLTVDVFDTTPPTLEATNLYKPLNYKFNIDDFIINVSDKSEYELSYSGSFDTSKYDDYPIRIIAKDKYYNETTKDVILSIGWAKRKYSIEVGNEINILDLVYNKEDINTISKKDIEKINKSREGIYYIKSIKNNNEIEIEIEKTKDITPPTLVLKNITIYEGKKIKAPSDFISKVEDKGSLVNVKMLNEIDYSKIGEQKINIEARDIDNNVTVKETTFKIIKDNTGPKISGLSKITINKGAKIDYNKGVKSYDDNFGNCEFSVDSSKVNINKYGTYYAIYTSSDKLGNKTTSKRVISVNHDQSDTNALVKSVADKLSSNVESIRDYVRSNIKYNGNSGGSDPVWYGLNNKVGNCIVHAYVFNSILKVKGYTTKIIWTTDKSHYWNMVYLNGKWVHMDSTPGSRHSKYSIMNDEMRYEQLQGRDWDRDKWPKAE